MTRKEIAETLRLAIAEVEWNYPIDYAAAFDRAIDVLGQEPCKDAISRAEAIRIASGYCHLANVAKELAKLPSVNPAPCENVPDINVGKCKAESEDKA